MLTTMSRAIWAPTVFCMTIVLIAFALIDARERDSWAAFVSAFMPLCFLLVTDALRKMHTRIEELENMLEAVRSKADTPPNATTNAE